MWEKLISFRITDRNNKIIAKNVLGAVLVKGFSLILSLFMMPCYLNFFSDNDVLGLWFAIISVLSWIMSFDLGIGNGLRNRLVEAIADGNKLKIRQYISTAYYMQGAVVLVITILGCFFIGYFNWNIFFNISDGVVSSEALLEVVQWTFIGIMMQIFFRTIVSILYALQLSFATGLLIACSNFLQLIFLIVYPPGSLVDNLMAMTISYIFTSNLPLVICTICIFMQRLRDVRPDIRYFKLSYSHSIMEIGGLFFLCQMAYMLVTCTNEFFISQYWGNKFVVDYRIYNSLFNLIGMLVSLALSPVWSMVTKAKAEGNFNWVISLYRNLKRATIGAILLEFLILPFLQMFIDLWLKDNSINVDYLYAICFAVYGSISIYLAVCSTMIAGFGTIKLAAIGYTTVFFLKYIIIANFSSYFADWIFVVIVNAILLLPYCIIQQYVLEEYLKKSVCKGKCNISN